MKLKVTVSELVCVPGLDLVTRPFEILEDLNLHHCQQRQQWEPLASQMVELHHHKPLQDVSELVHVPDLDILTRPFEVLGEPNLHHCSQRQQWGQAAAQRVELRHHKSL